MFTSAPSKKKSRVVDRSTAKRIKVEEFCVTESHPYGILPSGNLLFDGETHNASPSALPNQLLSDECWYVVLEFCEGADLASLVQCCRYFYAVGHEPSLWRDLVLRSDVKVISQFGLGWKDCFVLMAQQDKYVPHRPMRLHGIYSDYFHRIHTCRTFNIPSNWFQHDEIEASVTRIPYNQMTDVMFEKQFESINQPVVIQGACKEWRAYSKWTERNYLHDHTKGRTFRATSGTAPLPAYFTLSAYEEYCKGQSLEEGPLYLFDRTALEPGSVLWNDFMHDLKRTCPYWDPDRKDTSHDLFKVLGDGRRPDHTWLISGPKRSGSVFHIDPNATHAWNATIAGRKRWIFYPPGVVPPGVMPSVDGDEVVLPLSLGEWILQFWSEHTKKMKNGSDGKRPIEFTAFPGDIVFVPHGWWHLVVNLDEVNIAITHNYCSASNLKSVLKFIREKNDQVSGCRDRPESIKPEQLYEAFVSEMRTAYPDLLEWALSENDWACDAWTTNSEIKHLTTQAPAGENSEKASIISKAREHDNLFTFGFL